MSGHPVRAAASTAPSTTSGVHLCGGGALTKALLPASPGSLLQPSLAPPCSICPHQARGDQPAPLFCLISVPCPGNLISSLPGLMLPAGTRNAGLRPCPPSGGLQSPGRVDRCTRAWSRAGHVEAWAVLQWGAHRVSLPQPGSPAPPPPCPRQD